MDLNLGLNILNKFMKNLNILLIGFGPHARRIYYPIIKNEEKSLNAKIVYAVDLQSQKQIIEEYLQKRSEIIPIYYIKNKYKKILNNKTVSALNKVIQEYKIDGVIISTEPLSHVLYADWALSKGLHILMDKPISSVINSSTSEKAAEKIFNDYKYLKVSYLKAKKRYGDVIFSLMAQRRYHPAFQKMKNLIQEVFQQTNCPITSMQSFHSDGQWRLPSEIIDIEYHSYNDGYGKCSHTGYHALDIVPWLIDGAEAPDKKINNVDIFTNFIRPKDFISELNLKDYKKIFPNFTKYNIYKEKEFRNITKNYGEIDAFNSFAFKHNEDTITLGSLNFNHNGFSQRGWLKPKADLYKGNGRVRHESYYIEQGPFQAISFISYQSTEINSKKKNKLFDIGGEYNLDIHVFRNNNLFPKWKNYQKFSIKDLDRNIIKGYSRGHQEDARRKCIVEFMDLIRKKNIKSISDYLDHERGTILLANVYKSAARRFKNKNPVVNVKF